ncbi:MAG: Fic family protein [Nanoarchaeota archaeon]
MVYHEVRKVKGKKLHYLVHNARKDGKWVKKSKLIGTGEINAKKIKASMQDFEEDILKMKKYEFLSESDVERIESSNRIYNKKINEMKEEEYAKFQQSFFTELTYNSNAIEGSTLDLQETSLVVNDGIAPEGKTLREVYEARNHMKALKFIKEAKGDLDELFILRLHKIILEDVGGRFAGRYRESNVRIFGSDVKFPLADKVPQMMKNLVYWYKKNKKRYHTFELAVLVSMKFVTIHPFIDGNGRVSRLLMNFLLRKRGYPWVNVYNKKRQKYLRAVRTANEEDYSEIFPFLIDTLEENLKDFGF